MADTRIEPVGTASALPGTSAWTQAVFNANEVPVGSELYLHKQEGRMRMELEVANENALHHAENSRRLIDKNHHLRQFKRKAVFLFGQIVGEGKISDEHKEAIALLVREASQEDG